MTGGSASALGSYRVVQDTVSRAWIACPPSLLANKAIQ